MRKKIFGVPIVVVVIALVIPLVAFAAYTILILTGEVTVSEAITVTPTSFTASMYPAETVTETLTLTNAGSIAIEVNFTWSIDPVGPEITVTVPAKVTVPGAGSTTADIKVAASKSAVPGSYSISVGVTR